MVAEDPVQRAQLRGPVDPARRRLLDVDVRDGPVQVLVNTQRDGRERNGFPQEPAYALLLGGFSWEFFFCWMVLWEGGMGGRVGERHQC